jgi:transposase
MGQLSGFTREELEALVLQLLEQAAVLEKELADLRGGGGGSSSGGGKPATKPASAAKPVPAFVKANRPKRENKEHKRRPQGHARGYSAPTEIVVHAVEACPDCGRKLEGGTPHRVREVIDIPVLPVEITHHVLVGRWCGVCQERRLPSVDLSGVVVGKRRLGVRVMGLVSYLCTDCRMPKRAVRRLLRSLYALEISVGEISELLHAVARHGREMYEGLRQTLRNSAYVHADETGWREDGLNGYLWSFSNPRVRYFKYDRSRGHQVPEAELGEDFRGILASDFYSAYSFYPGEHQRCWAHLLRDLDDLVGKHPDDAGVGAWVGAVKRVYYEALDFRSEKRRARVKAREHFQQRISALARPYAGSALPQGVLAQRIERFLPELFTFVEYPEVPSDNNAAERSLRPPVIARKISGGTRSPRGSTTAAILMSLFGTWKLRQQDGLHACTTMLTDPSP